MNDKITELRLLQALVNFLLDAPILTALIIVVFSRRRNLEPLPNQIRRSLLTVRVRVDIFDVLLFCGGLGLFLLVSALAKWRFE